MTPDMHAVRTPVMNPVRGLLAAAASTHSQHQALVGGLPDTPAAELRDLVERAGLTGRGGAAFPTERKLAAVSAGRGAVVVANGAEGEPASSKDLTLIKTAPHLVLDGLALAARATKARSVYFYAPERLLDTVLRPALTQRQDKLRVSLVPSPDTFVSGQETAVVAAVQGLRPLPMHVTPVYQRGVNGRPTLVQNVETLAHLALIARYGVEWFLERGSAADPGTRLLTVSGAVRRPAVLEVAGGTTLGEAISRAGGPSGSLQAVLVGGYHGGWVPWNAETVQLPLVRSALADYDAAPGAGVLVGLDIDRCGLDASAAIARYLAGQSAGQCGPCRNGLPTIGDHLTDLAAGVNAAHAASEIARVCASVEGRGACHHPDGTVRMVRSAMRTFRTEVGHHLNGQCTGSAHDVRINR
jgi:NADH:ubiquinone oxidoreductase subunit F (NADH-binding)